MSGICGLFNLDAKPVTDAGLRTMTALLERRGPERTEMWRDTCAGLGHTLLATTPELQIENQPFVHAESGCVVTADVRLDNRDDLIQALGFAQRPDSPGDAELILAAYLQWGERCPERLLGDFAFSIWDPRHRTLFCARDHFGLRPLYYHHAPGQRFAFASDPRAILVLPEVPYAINEGRIADFLVPELEWIDYTSTFFEAIYRLPPGHRVLISPNGIKLKEYWKPTPGPDLGRLSDEAFAEGFLEVFTRAVEARLRAPPGSVGSMLSGGMDSGSVVAVAKDLLSSGKAAPLATFSAAMKQEADCAESRALRAAAAMPSLSPTFVYLEDLGTYDEQLISGNEEPFDGEAMLLKAVYRAASAHERSILLDGAGGDVVLSEGSYIARLLRRGHWLQAYREIRGEDYFWGGGLLLSSSREYLQAAFVPEAVKKQFRGRIHDRRVAEFLQSSLVSRDFAEHIDVKGRFKRMRQPSPGDWSSDYATERCRAIRPSVTAGRERYARLAAAYQVEARDPFLDKRVVDFCSRLPGRLRMNEGWYKFILRDVMAGRLPDDVRWLRGKPHLGWRFNAGVTLEASRRGSLSVELLWDTLAGFVDRASLEKAWQEFQGGGDGARIHSANLLSVWLKENARRPVVPE